MERQESEFVWDEQKEAANIQKHRVNFATATKVFADVYRKIYLDEKHSEVEERLICLGKVEGRVLTVRFVYREGKIRIVGAGYWRKGRKIYEI